MLIILYSIYVLLISLLIIGFIKLKETFTENINPTTGFNIVIPFRNEAENLPQLLQSLLKLNYPKELVSIYFIDDDSTDNSSEIIKNQTKNSPFCITILKNATKSKSPKKDAIQLAISHATKEWIITTDADCLLPKNWLKSYDQHIKNTTSDMVCGPVTYQQSNNTFYNWQTLDFLSLIGTTMGAFGLNTPILCNGANLAYKKEAFIKVGGFNGNTNIASGDDIFLLEKIVKSKNHKASFIKNNDTIVTTKAVNSTKNLISQRVRWASKTSNYNNNITKLIGIFILIIQLSTIYILLFKAYQPLTWLLLLSKWIIDGILIGITLNFTKQINLLKHYPLLAVIHPFFNTFIGIKSLFGGYQWKDRKFKT